MRDTDLCLWDIIAIKAPYGKYLRSRDVPIHLGTEIACEAKLFELRYCEGVERIFLTVGIAKRPIRLWLQVFGKKTLTCTQIPM